MSKDNTFTYCYSAKQNEELQKIRNRYLPKTESKVDELVRLDKKVQSSGMIEGLSTGIVGALVFGLGMCLAMQVLGSGALFVILGIVIGMIGAVVMALAYPIYRKTYNKAKERHTPRILELTAELSGIKENLN